MKAQNALLSMFSIKLWWETAELFIHFISFQLNQCQEKTPKKLEESENVHSIGKSKRMETQLSALWNV